MSEFTLGTLAAIALGVCVFDCFLWSWGGRGGKWKRRYLGSFVQILGINIISIITGTWVWQFALSLVPEIASRCLGYSGNTTGEKVLKRVIFATGSLAVGVILAWGVGFNGKVIGLLICQVIASIVSVILGIKGILPAAVEEVFICFSLKYINYGYLFIKAVTV